MEDAQKKVFLSYRRALGAWMARSVYQYLERNGYTVFMDVESLDSGEFPDVILHQIEATPHFLVVLIPGSLERTIEPDDWLRREIEHALKHERNIVPLLADQFTFEGEEKRLRGKSLPQKMKELSRHNGIEVPSAYFNAAMARLTDRFLKKRVNVTVMPTPAEELPIVKRMRVNAASAKATAGRLGWAWSPNLDTDAPTLKVSKPGPGVEWTPVFGATSYVLESSYDDGFLTPIELYKGTETNYSPFLPSLSLALRRRSTSASASLLTSKSPDLPGLNEAIEPMNLGGPLTTHYRVKAKGGFAFLDSPWSNIVTMAAPARTTFTVRLPLVAPVLERDGSGWKWTPSTGAAGYLLQESFSDSFEKVIELYDGPETQYSNPFLDWSSESFPSTTALPPAKPAKAQPPIMKPSKPFTFSSRYSLFRYARVKAKGGLVFADSPWSNVVTY